MTSGVFHYNDEILPQGGASAEKMHAMESEEINNDEILKYDASMMSDVSMMQDLVCMHSGQSRTKCF